MAIEVAAWPSVALGEVMKQNTAYVSELEPRLYPKLSVKWWGKGAVLDTPADGAMVRMSRHQLARPGQVIVSEIWAKHGSIGIVPAEGAGALITSHFFLFDMSVDRILPQYMDYLIQANYLTPLMAEIAQGTTSYAAIRPQQFLSVRIPLPPLDEQRRIVARIEALVARIAEARGLRRAALAEREALLRCALNAAFPHSGLGTVTLESACAAIIDNLHSNPVYSDSGVPCVRSPDVGWGTLNLASALRTSEQEYQRRTVRGEPMPGDIVLVREGGGTGKAALVEKGQRFSLGQRVMILRLDRQKALPKYFLYQLLSPAIYDAYIVPLSKGSASPHLNIGTLRKFPFRLPPLREQEQVVIGLDAIRRRMDELRRLQDATTEELEALLPSVLDRAFRGEL